MAVGAEGSGTRSLALQAPARRRRDGRGRRRFLPIGGEEALTALDADEVDVVFQVAGIEAPIVRTLLRRRDLRQMSLVHAMAYREAQRPSHRADGAARRRRHRRRPAFARRHDGRDDGQSARAERSSSGAHVSPARHGVGDQQHAGPSRGGADVPERAGTGHAGRRGGAALLQVGQAVPAQLSAVLGGEFRRSHAHPADPDLRRADSGDQVRAHSLHVSSQVANLPLVRAADRGRSRSGAPAGSAARRALSRATRRDRGRDQGRRACRTGCANRRTCCARRSTWCASVCKRRKHGPADSPRSAGPRDATDLGTPGGLA